MTEEKVLHCTFRIGFTAIQFRSDNPVILRTALQTFGAVRLTRALEMTPKIRVSLLACLRKPLPSIPERAIPFYSDSNFRFFLHNGYWLVDYRNLARLRVDLKKERITGFLKSDSIPKPDSFLELIYPLFELLRRRGIFSLHAGAVSWQGQGLIFPGRAGAGKSTLVLHLVDPGFKFISDDRCLLFKNRAGFFAFGLREKVRVFLANVACLPRLKVQLGDKPGAKKSFDIDEVYPDAIVKKAKIKAIILPFWTPELKTRLEPVSASYALKTILPLSVEAFFPDSARYNFEFLGELVEKIPGFRLYLGKDRERWHRIIRGLLDKNQKD